MSDSDTPPLTLAKQRYLLRHTVSLRLSVLASQFVPSVLLVYLRFVLKFFRLLLTSSQCVCVCAPYQDLSFELLQRGLVKLETEDSSVLLYKFSC